VETNNFNEAEKLFSKLCPLNSSKKMFTCCKSLLSSASPRDYGGGGADSLVVQHQSTLDRNGPGGGLVPSEAAIPTLLSVSPRRRQELLGPVGSETSPAPSQIQLLSEKLSSDPGAGVGGVDSSNLVEPFVPVRILVVDDAPTALKITTRMLTKIGCEVMTATNGLEAVDLLKDLTKASLPWFTAIVLDLQMPVMDGLEACQKIRALEEKMIKSSRTSYRTPQLIVAVSVNADEATREEAIHSGFDYFMPKPFRVDEFETILNSKDPQPSS
jgi:CheY-like chemotaxis protein